MLATAQDVVSVVRPVFQLLTYRNARYRTLKKTPWVD